MWMAVDTWYKMPANPSVTHLVCLILGSNIEPDRNIPHSVFLLQAKLPILRVSSVWESASGECCYPDYLNMAVLVSTSLDAPGLKEHILRPMEAQMGRVRTADKNASRPIDLDIVLFDGELMDPEIWQVVYKAVPVAELFPDLHSESGEVLQDTARRLAQSTPILKRLDIVISLSQ